MSDTTHQGDGGDGASFEAGAEYQRPHSFARHRALLALWVFAPAALLLYTLALSSGCGPGFGASEVTATVSTTSTSTPGPRSGQVLIVGGESASAKVLSSAELYQPATAKFKAAEPMATARMFHTATLLQNGKVLIAGGLGTGSSVLASAELYDPSTGAFAKTGTMTTPRYFHTATLLQNGSVLIAGGIGSSGSVLQSAELYDPSSGTFAATGTMVNPRALHAAALIPTGTQSGAVLLCGGIANSSGTLIDNTAELYDPTSGSFTAVGNMLDSLFGLKATAFASGTLAGSVLVAGGQDIFGVVGNLELYNQTTSLFGLAGLMSTSRIQFTATLLQTGAVLYAGGLNGSGTVVASADLYTPGVGISATGAMTDSRRYHTATMFTSGTFAGQVLVAGGQDAASVANTVATAEIYSPSSGTFAATGTMTSSRFGHTATLLP